MTEPRSRPPAGPRVALAGLMLATALAYYVGSLIGLQLQVPGTTPSILWPPNAILSAILILSPVHRWWAVLLAVLPVHLFTQLPTGWPVALILSFFTTNCLEALLAATALRRLNDSSTRLDTFRRFGGFIAAVVVGAPLVSSFADAAVASWFLGNSYWLVWRIRMPSNVLAQLTITLAVVGVATARWRPRPSFSRTLEAVLLAACVLGSGWFAFGLPFESDVPPGFATDAPLVIQLPFVLWAAFRFGPKGTSLALLVMTACASWAVLYDPDFQPASGQSIFTMQLFLISVGVTLLGLASLVEERRQSAQHVSERLRFEELLFEFSRAFVGIRSTQMNAVSSQWLERIGGFLHLDCVRLFQLESKPSAASIVSEWRRPGVCADTPFVIERDAPWILRRVSERQPVVLESLTALPREAARDRLTLAEQGYEAVLFMPMLAGDELVGALAFATVEERRWGQELIASLRLMSDVLANALARRRTDDALRSSEDVKASILNSLSGGVAVIDAAGRLVEESAQWDRVAEHSQFVRVHGLRAGDDLLQACSVETANGIRAVLSGSMPRFLAEHVVAAASGTRWWLLVVSKLNHPKQGAVLNLTEITEQRRAEVAAQQSRQQLAHVGRVATMGELTGSLAHQLNQPLTGVMCNAQAARRLMQADPFDGPELQAALEDIVDDARRASDVVHRLRELLRGGEFQMVPVNLVEVVREVFKLLESDAIIRNVMLTLEVESEVLSVCGDRVQLQQVVLNLIMNAFEAIGEHDARRLVVVACDRVASCEVRVTVRDSGGGLVPGSEELVFEPFYTTKAQGMGMGLSIARSIVETHGGRIRVASNPGGTVFEFTLPVSPATEAA